MRRSLEEPARRPAGGCLLTFSDAALRGLESGQHQAPTRRGACLRERDVKMTVVKAAGALGRI